MKSTKPNTSTLQTLFTKTMETTLIPDTITTTTTNHQTLTPTFTNPNTFTPSHFHHHQNLHITSQSLPTDAVAPPPVKPTVIPSSRAKTRARVRRKIKTAGDDGDGDGYGYVGGGGGFFGGGSGGGNGDGFGWDESEQRPVDPAFDFVYELLSWFVLSNCLYFAVKRVFRIVVDGSGVDGDDERRFR